MEKAKMDALPPQVLKVRELIMEVDAIKELHHQRKQSKSRFAKD